MRKTPPPLHLLPAFAAAAKHLSFRKAAEELNVTPSAVSQQIKTLEDYLGETLFLRQSRQVSLTLAGSSFLNIAEQLLSNYHKSYENLYRQYESNVIRVSTLPQIACDVLIPQLGQLTSQHPDLDLRIEMADEIIDFDEEWLDAAIRVGDGNWPGLETIKLCELSARALSSKTLLERLTKQGEDGFSADQTDLTLIHSRTAINDWQTVQQRTGIDLSGCRSLHFDSYLAAQQATISGLGVMLALMPLCKRPVSEGQLVYFSQLEEQYELSCYLVYPESRQSKPAFRAFLRWVEKVFEDLTG